tara:strand:+ start:10436 stop:12544 length:2109 start_codon:yes stop_codon:yes gene_type:complete
MAKSVVEIEMRAQKAQNTLGGLIESLGFLKNAIEDATLGSDDFKRLADNIQKTESKIKNLTRQMEGLDSAQTAESFLKTAEGIAGGFVAAQGAMTLLGVESENLEKLQAKVQGAIAIAMGVRMMAEASLHLTTAKRIVLEKVAIAQTKAGIKLHKMAASAAVLYRNGLRAIGLSAKVSAKGMKTLKIAIASTGIGLIVIAIGTLVAYWDDIKGLASGVSAEMREQLESATAAKDAAIENLEATEGSTNQLKLQGKSQREILQIKLKDIDAAIQASEVEIERQKSTAKSQIKAAQRNEMIAQGIIGFLMLPITTLLATIDAVTFGLSKVGVMDATNLTDDFTSFGANLLGFDAAETEAEINAELEQMDKGLNKLKEKRAGFELEIIAIDDAANDKKSQQAAQNREKEQQRLEKFLQEMQTTMEEAHLTAEQKEILAVQRKYDALIAEAEHFGMKSEQLVKDREDAIAKIEERFAQEKQDKIQEILDFQTGVREMELIDAEREFDKKIEQALELGMATEELERLKLLKLKEIRETHDAEDLEKTNELRDAKIEAQNAFVNAVGGAMGEISGLFEEGSKASKAAALAEIAINTGLGFIQGLDIAQKSAKATGPGAALAFPIFYATQIAAVIGAVKKAKSALGAGGGASPPDQPKSVSAPTRSGNFTLQGGGGPQGTQPALKTFVVTDELTDSQAQLADIRRRSTI